MLPGNPEAVSFAEFFFGVGLSCTGLGVWLRQRELAPKHWLHAYGIIRNVSIIERFTGSIYTGSAMIPIVEYEYLYNNQKFISARRRASDYVAGNQISAEEITSRYPVGSSVKVFINPKHPAISALEYGTTPLSWVLIILGVFLTGCGAIPFVLR